MPAQIIINEWNGAAASPTKTNKTNQIIQFKRADNSNVDTNDPIPIPLSGQTYSFEKWIRLAIGTNANNNTIQNIRAYTDGVNDMGTDVEVFYAVVQGAYEDPQIPNEANYPPLLTSANLGGNDLFTADSANPIDLSGTNSYTGANVDIGYFLVMVLAVKPNAAPTVTPEEQLVFLYDEV